MSKSKREFNVGDRVVVVRDDIMGYKGREGVVDGVFDDVFDGCVSVHLDGEDHAFDFDLDEVNHIYAKDAKDDLSHVLSAARRKAFREGYDAAMSRVRAFIDMHGEAETNGIE